jgi:hypothetical protein
MRNATGLVRHETKDRCIRVLGGQLFVTSNGETTKVVTNQVCSLQHGTEYELASSGDNDVEMLVVQGEGYEEDLVHISEATTGNAIPAMRQTYSLGTRSRASTERAQQTAEQLKSERDTLMRTRVSPVPKRPPLPGQMVMGANPRPIGAGGFGSE